MPRISAFYGDDEATIDIASLRIIAGGLPRRGLRLVMEWARVHAIELQQNWDRARRHEPLLPIDPLA